MDYDALERTHGRLLRDHRWTEALETLCPLIAAAGETRGFGLMLRAQVRFAHWRGAVLEALQDLDEAWPLVRSSPDLVYRVVINYLHMAYVTNWTGRVPSLMRRLVRPEVLRSEASARWHGRYLINSACYHGRTGVYLRSMRMYGDAVRWHREHTGPWDEHDRLCMLRVALTGQAAAALQLGQCSIAKPLLAEASSLLADSTRQDAVRYVSGLLASSHGHTCEAVSWYREAMEVCKDSGDFGLRMQIADTLAGELARAGEAEKIQSLCAELIRECATAELPDLVLKWQRLRSCFRKEAVG